MIGIEITATEPADTHDCMPSDNAHSVRYPHTQLGPFCSGNSGCNVSPNIFQNKTSTLVEKLKPLSVELSLQSFVTFI